MASGTVVLQRYANALLELARDAGTQEQVEAELGALDEMLAENADLRANLGNPRITREVKRRFDEEGITIPFPQRDVHHYNPQES